MKRTLLISVGLILMLALGVIAIPACGGREESNEPEYEQVLPPTDMPEVEGGEYTVDLDALRAAVDENPDDRDARFAYMIALRRSGEIMDALDQARILGEVSADNDYISIARLEFAQMVLDDVPADYPDRAALVQEAIDGMWIGLGYEPASIPGHLALGRLALEAGDYDRALHHLSIALTVMEIGYELRMKMAEIYIEREDYEHARAHLDAAESLAEEADDRNALREIHRLQSQLR
jgi:tetratricopeptide (TPR) repeat protein